MENSLCLLEVSLFPSLLAKLISNEGHERVKGAHAYLSQIQAFLAESKLLEQATLHQLQVNQNILPGVPWGCRSPKGPLWETMKYESQPPSFMRACVMWCVDCITLPVLYLESKLELSAEWEGDRVKGNGGTEKRQNSRWHF